MTEAAEAAREKYLTIAYKCALVNKDKVFLNLLRNNYITFGAEDMYLYNCVVSYSYFMLQSDAESLEFLAMIVHRISRVHASYKYE